MDVSCTHSSKSLGPFPKLPIKNLEKKKIPKKGTRSTLSRRQPAVTRRPRVDAWTGSACLFFLQFFFSPALHFLRKWSTLAGWLQHMPAVPKVHLKTSNIHNF
jgi:hypothetical protein